MINPVTTTIKNIGQYSRVLHLLALSVLAVTLFACSAEEQKCDANDDACGTDSNLASSINGSVGTESLSSSELSNCVSADADPDGDGFGFENGVSCLVPSASGGTYTVDDINHVVVVTGQSNVEAPLTAFDPVLDQPHPRVFAFTDEGWQVADLHQVWDENAHPGNHSLTDPSNSPNNNLIFHYGKTFAQQNADAVPAFIVLAAPGKGIANWDYESPFYLKMRNKITDALAQIPNVDKVDVMLWHQGESDWLFEGTSDVDATGFTDTDSPEYRNYYEWKLQQVIANFRSEPWAVTDLPFICGETRIAEGVNIRLRALNDDNDQNTACVMATDLPFRLSDPSGAHFSAAGLRELGRRYMQQYQAIVNQ